MTTIEIRYARTLEYYDGIQLFEARDAIGGTYIAALLETNTEADQYLLVGCAPQELRIFRNGGTDLRNLMTRSAVHGWYLADLTDLQKPLSLKPREEDKIPEDLLPKPGFQITAADVDHSVITQARESENVVIQVTIEPAEGAIHHGIRASSLGGLLTHFQNFIRHAVHHAMRYDEPAKDKGKRYRDGHLLDIIEIAPGSTKLTFQGVYTPPPGDLPPLVKALETLDEIFMSADAMADGNNPFHEDEEGMEKAYRNLMKFLRARKTSFSYTWAQPTSPRPSHTSMPLQNVNRLAQDIELLGAGFMATPYQETRILEGTLEMVDEPKKRWRISSEPRKSVTGTVYQDGPSLSNLIINNRYRFHCVETRTDGRGRPTATPRLYLKDIKHLN